MSEVKKLMDALYKIIMRRSDVVQKNIDVNLLKGAVLIESMIDSVLTAVLLHDVKQIENPPLSMTLMLQKLSTRDKVEILRASNLLDHGVCADIHKLMDVRNVHAHVHENVEEVNFPTEKFAQLQVQIVTSFLKNVDPRRYQAAALRDALNEKADESPKPV